MVDFVLASVWVVLIGSYPRNRGVVARLGKNPPLSKLGQVYPIALPGNPLEWCCTFSTAEGGKIFSYLSGYVANCYGARLRTQELFITA